MENNYPHLNQKELTPNRDKRKVNKNFQRGNTLPSNSKMPSQMYQKSPNSRRRYQDDTGFYSQIPKYQNNSSFNMRERNNQQYSMYGRNNQDYSNPWGNNAQDFRQQMMNNMQQSRQKNPYMRRNTVSGNMNYQMGNPGFMGYQNQQQQFNPFAGCFANQVPVYNNPKNFNPFAPNNQIQNAGGLVGGALLGLVQNNNPERRSSMQSPPQNKNWNNYAMNTYQLGRSGLHQMIGDIFMKWDMDQNGTIDVKEFPGMITELFARKGLEPPTMNDIWYLMWRFDEDQDGVISYKEWTKMVLALGGF